MKYTAEELKAMAQQFIEALNKGDNRCPEITQRLMKFGYGPWQSLNNIKYLAK